jgi:hypothetical protein
MRIVKKPGVVLLVCGALSVLSAPLALAGGDELAIQLKETIAKKNEVRVRRTALVKEHDEALASLGTQIEEAKRETDQLEQRLKAASKRRGSESPQKETLEPDLGAARVLDWIASQRRAALPVAHRLVTRMEGEVSHDKKERLERARKVVAQLEADGEDAQIEGLSALWSLLASEARLGRSVELRNEPVELGSDRRINAYVLRVGRVLVAFVEEGGGAIGVATPKGWNTDLDNGARRAIASAVDVLRRRQPPALLALPVWVEGTTGKEAP